MQDLGVYTTIGGNVLNPTDPANPCGLIARSLFNDTYVLSQNDSSISINQTNIAWDSDKKGRYVNSVNYTQVQWTDVENEHFMVWMRPAGLPDFRKLWGRVYTELTPGKYILTVYNNFQVSSFNGRKSFVLSTANILGGKNSFLGVAYVIVGGICIMVAFFFWVMHKKYNSDKKYN